MCKMSCETARRPRCDGVGAYLVPTCDVTLRPAIVQLLAHVNYWPQNIEETEQCWPAAHVRS